MSTIIKIADRSKRSCDRKLTELFPLSIAQRSVWFNQIREGYNPVYNLGLSVLLEDSVDESLLEKAINLTIERYDILRLVMHSADGSPFQRILPELKISLPVIDLSGTPNAESAAETHIKREFQKSFHLEGSPLFSFQLIRVSASRSYWLHRYHQLITDSVDGGAICRTIMSTYNILLLGKAVLDAPVSSYRQLIMEEAEYMASKIFLRDSEYWREKLFLLPPPLFPPAPASDLFSALSEQIIWQVDRVLFKQAKDYARAAGCTIRHFILALISCCVARVSGESEVLIGAISGDVNFAPRRKTTGIFSSETPLRVSVDHERPFGDLLKSISSELRLCYKHRRFPISEINRYANLSTSGRSSLRDISVSFNNRRLGPCFGNLRPTTRRLIPGSGQTPLVISVNDYYASDNVSIVFEFHPGRVDIEAVKIIQARLAALLNSILTEPGIPIKQLSLLSPLYSGFQSRE